MCAPTASALRTNGVLACAPHKLQAQSMLGYDPMVRSLGIPPSLADDGIIPFPNQL